jgi:hypothetical protein
MLAPLLKAIGLAADIATLAAFPLTIVPVFIWWAWARWAVGEMKQSVNIVLWGLLGLGGIAYAIEFTDRVVLANPPTRLRVHYSSNSPKPEIIQSDNIFGDPASFQFVDDGRASSDPMHTKWTLLFIVFEKPITARTLRVVFEGGDMSFERKNFTSRTAAFVFEGPIGNRIIDIEARSQ